MDKIQWEGLVEKSAPLSWDWPRPAIAGEPGCPISSSLTPVCLG